MASSESSKTSDTSIKYHKLATEYAKLRSQFNVVKKAVVDEQNKNVEITEALRVKEVKERKSEAEMEAINFRNQQLTKRIQVLQTEIDAIEHSAPKKKGSSSKVIADTASLINTSETINSVMGEELQAKIEENAKLHAKLSDIDKKYEDLVTSLQSRIKDLESEAKTMSQIERAEDNKYKDIIEDLKAEKTAASTQIQLLEKQLIDHQDRITALTVQLESVPTIQQQSLPSSIADAKESSSSSSAASSIPLTQEELKVKSVELLSQFSEGVSDFIASLSDFHTYWEHRIKDIHNDGIMSSNALSLSKLLLDNVSHLKPIEDAFQEGVSQVLSRNSNDYKVSTLSYFNNFAKRFNSYMKYAKDVESLTLSCLQSESNHYSCPSTQKLRNSEIQSSLRMLNGVLERVGNYLETLTIDDKDTQLDSIENLNVVLLDVRQRISELFTLYSSKASEENQLPTVTNQLENTNNCIVSALNGMTNCIYNLSKQMFNALPRIQMLINAEYEIMMSEPHEVESTSNQDKQEDQQHSAETIGQKNEQIQQLKDQNQRSEQIIEEMRSNWKNAEQNREHWKLEFKLLELKYNKLKEPEVNQEIVDDENTKQSDHETEKESRENDSKDETEKESEENNSKEETEKESVENDPQKSDDDKWNEIEEKTKDIFLDRINELFNERFYADGKAVSFYLECESLQKRFWISEMKKEQIETQLEEKNKKIIDLEDELKTTSSNYENQMGLLTEHVANLNDKLSNQTEEIDTLKYQLTKKKHK